MISYVGDDYELSPDKELVRFDFIYGDEVEPGYVTFTSVGKNQIEKITGIDLTEFGQDSAYTAELVGDMKVKITPNMNSVWDYDGAEETLVITAIDTDGTEFTAPEVVITSNIRKSPEKYSLSIENGDFAFKGAYTGIDCTDTLTVEGGTLYAEGEQRYGIARPVEMIIGSGASRVEVKSSNAAVYTNGMTVDPALSVTAPKGAVEKAGKVYEADGRTLAKHVVIEPNKVVVGDVNLDGQITISDVTAIQCHVAEVVQFTGFQLAAADTNGDGKVDVSDATHLQKYIAEIDGIVLGKQHS